MTSLFWPFTLLDTESQPPTQQLRCNEITTGKAFFCVLDAERESSELLLETFEVRFEREEGEKTRAGS